MLCGSEVVRTGSDSCPVAGFSARGAESLGFAAVMLVFKEDQLVRMNIFFRFSFFPSIL
jgi:hypothetical protein